MHKTQYKIRISDIILSVIIIVLALSIYLFTYLNGRNSSGKQAVVTIAGKEYARYSLDENQQFKIKTDNGYNIIQIKNSKVSITDADCPDKYCAKHKEISQKGEVVVCLPHKLTVEITDDTDSNKDSEIDAVAE